MWGPWSAFGRQHHDVEQAEIARAARELAVDLVARLRPLLPFETPEEPERDAGVASSCARSAPRTWCCSQRGISRRIA